MKKLFRNLFMLAVIAATGDTQAQTITLLGMTEQGGYYGEGNIFQITSAAVFTDEYDFNNSGDGTNPAGSFYKAGNGVLYGLASLGGANDDGTIFSFNTSTGVQTTLYNFRNNIEGYFPHGSLIKATDGLLYGTTENGNSLLNDGTIFSFDIAADSIKTLHVFNYTAGAYPLGNLIQATNGLLYGLTSAGGGIDEGNIFSYNINTGTYTDVYDFGNSLDGFYPYGSLIQGNNGLLYGLTSSGGLHDNGTIFSFNTNTGTETDLYDFNNSPDANYPHGSLLQAGNGLLYGLTEYGGANQLGAIFSFDITNDSLTVLFSFDNGTGDEPYGSLIQGSNGLLYGLTAGGGASDVGTVFSYNIALGTETTLHDFDVTDGSQPYGDLLEVLPTGINQLSVNSNRLTVSPNPTSGAITISSTKTINEITVTNLVGQVIFKSPLGDSGVKQFNFELKDEGMYFVTVKAGDGIATQKLIVAR